MPLPPETVTAAVNAAKAALKQLDAADVEIRKAQSAGLDVSQHLADSAAQRAGLNRFLGVYGR